MTQGRSYIGLHGAARAYAVSELVAVAPRLIVVTKDGNAAQELLSDLEFFSKGRFPLLNFPSWELLPFEQVSPQVDISAERISTLFKVRQLDSYCCVASVDAIVQKILPFEELTKLAFDLQVEQTINKEELIARLVGAGYIYKSLVEDLGDMTVRGGVVDFFQAIYDHPIRVEFFADRIERISIFDVTSQRSKEDLSHVKVLPVRELINATAADFKIDQLSEAQTRIKERAKQLETPLREVARVLSCLEDGTQIPALELIHAIFCEHYQSFFEFAGRDVSLVVDDPVEVQNKLESFTNLIAERQVLFEKSHTLIPKMDQIFLEKDQVDALLWTESTSFLNSVELLTDIGQAREIHNLASFSHVDLVQRLSAKVGSGKALRPLADEVNRLREEGFSVVFSAGSRNRAERLKNILLGLNLAAEILECSVDQWRRRAERYPLVILVGLLSQGFVLPQSKLCFFSESDVFGNRSGRNRKTSARAVKRILDALAQLKIDNHVVHVDYGIGIYRGLKHMLVEGRGHDFLIIEYAEGSKLYLPVENIGRIQKYVAADGSEPKLDRLGSNRWVKTKAKVRESIVTLAGDLIKLYAARSIAKGWRFEPYGAEDDRFAEGFPFEETPDQLQAIVDTLNDMGNDKPMDRLVCGDVGFGKTEIAIRAAFKAVQHAKQVAVLVPTTVLVEQHYRNFKERFLEYPVKVGAVSRFYDANANKETIAKLASGEIDIVIGTHKLLGKQIEFKDLGLLVIDEEHRFGVKQKETLKNFKKQLDVLTLTATPIPRTLQMSLVGIRDLSIIRTAPPDRRAVRTYVANYSQTMIRDAIVRELQRGGQCFFVHNRIKDIDLMTASLAQIVPGARFAFGHGQMDEKKLEDLMRRFIDKKIDVLVSTTIIEAGLDIPNANTIIINRADMMGLAELYQLRGRVGRSDRQAYAYFVIPELNKLGPDARERLKVLQSLDELGTGFNLAIRDLEIRGAGNLLGKDQSGFVAAVGIELYNQILMEAVLNLKGEEPQLSDMIDPEIKFPVNAFIPEVYIPDLSERLIIYQRLASLESPQEADELKSEISDRFGHFGGEVDSMIELMRLRSLLRINGIAKAESNQDRLYLSFHPKAKLNFTSIQALVKSDPVRFSFGKNLTLAVKLQADEIHSLQKLYQLVEQLALKMTLT